MDGRGSWPSRDYALALALKDFYLGRGRVDLRLGDQFTTLSSLPRFFGNLFYPSQYFRGGSISYQEPLGHLTLLAGTVTRSQSFLAESYRSLGERLGGLSWLWHLWDPFWLEGNLYLTRDEKDGQGNLVTRSNTVYRLAGLWQLWRYLHLAGEFMQSFNRPPGRPSVQDQAYRAGVIWQQERARLEANYRYLGPDFHLINNLFLPETNTAGYFLAGHLTPWRWLQLSGSYSSSRQNLVPQADQLVSETTFRSASFNLMPPSWPNLIFQYYQSNLATRRDFPVQVRGQTTGVFTEVNWRRWQKLEPYLRLDYFAFSSQTEGSNSYRRLTPMVGLRGYQQRFSWYLEGQDDRYSPHSAGNGYSGFYLRSGGSYYLSERFSLFGELGYRPKSHRFGGLFGLNWHLPKDLDLRLYGRLERGTMGGGDYLNHFYTNQITFQLSKTIKWGQRSSVSNLKADQEWVGSGSIEGYVFEDLNQNQLRDPGEPGFAGVTLRLADGTVVITDEKGYYRFPAVAAGTTTIFLETKRIPAKYTFLGDQSSTLEVRRRAQRQVDFPFVLGATVRGRVVAVNGHGPKTKGLPDVLVLIQPGDYNTFTDEEGNFVFLGLPPGTYQLSLHPESLPPFALIKGEALKHLSLAPGARVHHILFEVDLERPVIKLPTLATR